jgi:hypothetical protein
VRTKDSCWSVGTIYDPRELPGVSTASLGIGQGIYDPRELPGVSTASLGIGQGVTSGIRADPRGFTALCGLGGSGIWRMAHVGPKRSHGMAYDDTRHRRG